MSTITAPVSALDLVLGMGKATIKGKPAKAKVAADDGVSKLLAEYFEHDRMAKSHKASAETVRDQIISHARPLFYDACKTAGKSLSSVRIGNGTMTVTNNYSTINPDEGEALAEAFGDNYPTYFRRHIELAVNKESANDDDFLAELVGLVGADFFQKHFAVKHGIKVTDAFHTAMSLDRTTRDKAQPFIDGQVIKPYSPSIKLA